MRADTGRHRNRSQYAAIASFISRRNSTMPSRFGSAMSASVTADSFQTSEVSITAARKNAATYTRRV